jgi:hypothetical protein
LNEAQPKKSTIRKIAFSAYGDKMAAMNLEGSLFMNNFELGNSPNGLYQPYFCAKDIRNNDFAFADKESLIGAVSYKDKSFCVYDTLLPPRQS